MHLIFTTSLCQMGRIEVQMWAEAFMSHHRATKNSCAGRSLHMGTRPKGTEILVCPLFTKHVPAKPHLPRGSGSFFFSFKRIVFFNEVKFTKYRIYHLNHFKVWNSVVLVYTQCCATVTTISFRNIPIIPKNNSITPNSPLFPSLGNHESELSYEWSSIICCLLWLSSFTWH